MRGLQAEGGAPLTDGPDDPDARRPDGEAEPPTGTPPAPDPVSETPGHDTDSRAGSGSTGGETAGAPPAAGRRRVGLLIGLAAVIYVLDLITKTLVVRYLEGRDPMVLIPDVLVFQVIRNPGAAFSIGTGLTLVLTLIATGVVIAILRTARNLRSLPWAITLGLLLGGAFGNLTDRVFRSPAPLHGHVVDFVQVFPATGFPIFNVADSSIVCGGVLAVLLAWRGYQIDGTRHEGSGK
ncbi:signal peptidase II [Spongiactinospora sp. TRM90649]|uniref:signal peptidase II n=1 Tax=Spongiactinospora sp. TRM90649 TaxID=3031114 RepID=UPI0023F7F426|nr:signal peptidase II [Spongiactinospora sp. TRM90649]MDF5756874.1 signal peptidase II [Spongiactinospora sp. TRM90649]